MRSMGTCSIDTERCRRDGNMHGLASLNPSGVEQDIATRAGASMGEMEGKFHHKYSQTWVPLDSTRGSFV